MTYSYDRTASTIVQAEDEEIDIDLQELQVADYIVFLLALETYMGWLEETRGSIPAADATLRRGVTLARLAERQNLEAITAFIKSNLVSKASITLLEAAIRPPPTPAGLATRAVKIRTVLSKGGTATTKAVFGTSLKARKEVQNAIDASMVEDPDKALNQFAALVLRNKKLEKWIDEASEVVPPAGQSSISPVQEATKGATDASNALLNSKFQQEAKPGTDQSVAARTNQAEKLAEVEAQATEAAKKALAKSGEEDRPLTKSEVIGVATAAATSVTSDPDNPQNVPVALQGLDPEQQGAAMTGGKVRVSAGAGSGKSTTLLARTQYLIDHGAVPSRMMAMSFNKKAADELATKLAMKIGSDKVSAAKSPNPSGVRVGTMHSTFLKFINQFGTREQVNIFAKVEGKGGMVGASALFKSTKDIWNECFHDIEKGEDGEKRSVPAEDLWKMPPKSGRMMAYMNLFQGEGMSLEQVQAWVAEKETLEADQAGKFFEVYEGLKGGLGAGWRPNLCEKDSMSFKKFVDFRRAGKPRIGDFNDMLAIFRDILKANPAARKKIQEQFDHIMVDECQDLNPLQFEVLQLMTEHVQTDDPKRSFWMVGDDKQCVAYDTPISTGSGFVLAKNLKAGDRVLAFRNGQVVEQTVRHTAPTAWDWGFKITTEAGNTLTMSPNHKIWASDPTLTEDQMVVYLMYRSDEGFRVGITNKAGGEEEYLNRFGGRAFMEKAERLWVLDICSNREEALLQEETYSLTYGVPTMVFGADNRGINQERVNELFTRFGKNGGKILEAKHLSFDLPHWMSQTYTKHGRVRRTIQMIAHSSGSTRVSLEWSGSDLHEALAGVPFKTSEDRHRLRRYFANYREALSFAEGLQSRTGALLSRRLSGPEGTLRLLTASGLFVGMEVVAQDGVATCQDRIVSVEKVKSTFLDIDVDDASNFFGGGILSHNSIYQFRGADPNNFINLDKLGFKDRQITTNYRCAPEFIDAANKLIAVNKNQIPMEAKPRPDRARGEANLTVATPPNDTKAAVSFGQKVLTGVREGEPLSNFAVLARTNAELAVYQQVCAVVGIKFVQKKASAVFSAQETETFRAFAASVVSTDTKVLQDSFCQTLVSGGILRPKGMDKAEAFKFTNIVVKKAMAAHCLKNRIPLATFDPIDEANRNPDFLVSILTASGAPAWAAPEEGRKAGPLLEGISMIRSHMEDPGFNSADLFEALLELPVTELLPPDPGSRKWTNRTVTFRVSTEERLSARVAQEEADEDPDLETGEKSNLGTLEFVRLMMVPNEVDPNYNPLDPKQFHARFEGLADRAEELRIDPDEWEKKQISEGVSVADRKAPPGVYLGTIHSTKGAEWSDVTVLMPKGTFPMEREPRKPKENEVPEEALIDPEAAMEAERRLGYVALTRAKNSLTIMCPGGLSKFVMEAGLGTGQNVPQPVTETLGAVPATSSEVAEDPEPERAESEPEPGAPTPIKLASSNPLQGLQNFLSGRAAKYNYDRGAS